MKLKRNKLRDAITYSLVVGALSLASAGTAFAQDAQPSKTEKQDATTLDAITVTGTRIKSQTMTSASPVTEIGGENFTQTGALGVEDLVNQYPQLDLNFDNFDNNPSLGYATASLRELGSGRTLTLVNGRRMPGGASESTDLSIIPAAMIKRVDVLTGGASAVYGADAVAGVVNFILDDEFEGVSLNFGLTGYQHNNNNSTLQGLSKAKNFPTPTGNTGLDGKARTFDLVIGGAFGESGHAVGYLNYRKSDALLQSERDYSACAVDSANPVCAGSATSDPANFLAYDTLNFDGGIFTTDGNGNYAPGSNVYNFAPKNYFQRPDQRYTAGFMAKYEINENFTPYAEAMFVDRKSAYQIAESGQFANTGFELACDTPYIGTLCADAGIGTDTALIYILKRNVEGGPRFQDTNTQTYRFTTGVKGTIAGSWTYDAHFLYGATRSSQVGHNDMLITRLAAEITGCDNPDYPGFDGCIPYDVWHNNVSVEAALAASGTSFHNVDTTLRVLSAYATGDLPFGSPWAADEKFSLVVGAERRVTSFSTATDSDSLAGNFTGAGSATLDVDASESVTDTYLEMALPIAVGNNGIFNRLDGSLGYRHSNYELSGGANTYKFGLSASFLDNRLLLRGGYNRAIRAPTLNDLFYPSGIALDGQTDYCAGPNPTYTAAQCALTGLPTSAYGTVPLNPSGQYYGLIGGNPDLKPEVADTYTFGVAYEPIKNLNLALDWYRITIKDAISSVGYEQAQKLCLEQGQYCDLIHRNTSNGRYDLWLGSAGGVGTGYITDLAQNVGLERREGLDFNASYGFSLGPGRMETTFTGTYVLKSFNQPLASVASTGYDCKGKINVQCFTPQWRHVANARYSFGNYSVGLRWRYVGSTDYVDAYTGSKLTSNMWIAPHGGIGSYNYFDLSANASFGPVVWTVGVNNLADKEPPLTGYNGGINSGSSNSMNGYDLLGRYFFTNVSLRF